MFDHVSPPSVGFNREWRFFWGATIIALCKSIFSFSFNREWRFFWGATPLRDGQIKCANVSIANGDSFGELLMVWYPGKLSFSVSIANGDSFGELL
ncbi:MAG: hypothetical protein H6656_19080 [Ardenticatenaceae bacterium]|nr:hypothetical protein [Ardenticatenaceae bacterium]